MSKVFQKASRKQVRLRLALDGPSGSGKTFTGLRFAFAIASEVGGRVAVINTESGAIEKYLGLAPDGIEFDFDILTLPDYSPSNYTAAIQAAGREGYAVVLIDSLSHAWEGEGGALDQVDKKSERNKFTAWKDVTPQHRGMIEAILRSPCHVIATMRTRTEYVLEEDERGKKVPRKIGMKPVQREGVEYEFDIVADLDQQHLLKVSKTRCPEVDNAVVMKPGAQFIAPVIAWLKDGSQVPADYFAVNESELKSLQGQADTPRKKAAGPVDFVSQMKQKATEGAATSTSEEPIQESLLCDENQRLHIEDLFKQLGTTADDQAEILSRRNVTKLEQLKTTQASDLIGRLMKLHKEKVAAEKKELDEVPF